MSVARRCFNFAAAASLALCIVTMVLWLLSWGPLWGELDHHGTNWVFFQVGHLWIGPTFYGGEIPQRWEGWSNEAAGWMRYQSANGKRWTSVHVNLLLIVLLTGILPAVRYRPIERMRRKRRARQGRCPVCGYDLRATAPAGCCPECGTPKSAIEDVLRRRRISHAVSGPAAAVSLALCVATALLWVLSFVLLKGDHRGVKQVFVADGKLWIGPLFRGGEEAISSDGWNIGLASWTRSEGVWGGQWTSIQVELWLFILLFAVPPAIRYRVVPRIFDRLRAVMPGRGGKRGREVGSLR